MELVDRTFIIGTKVACSDGVCGTVTQVVIDPVARAMTDLVVEPEHRSGLGRLVPMALVEATPESLRLHCTLAEFDALESAEQTKFLPGTTGGYGGFGPGQALEWPYYGLGGMGMYGGLGSGLAMGSVIPPVIVTDTIPDGDIAIRRGQQVHASDGDIGKVRGLVLDPRNRHVTHILLQEGHLWGQRQVAIPIASVTGLATGVTVSLSKDEVRDLPPIDLHD